MEEDLLGDDEEFDVNIDNYDCPLREWITKENAIGKLRDGFQNFEAVQSWRRRGK